MNEAICLVIPLAQGCWVCLSRGSRRLLTEADPGFTVRICDSGRGGFDPSAAERAARLQAERGWLAGRAGPGQLRRRLALMRGAYDLAIGVALLIASQGAAIPALGGLYLLGKLVLRMRRPRMRLLRSPILDRSPVANSAHTGLRRLSELFADSDDERFAYMEALALAREIALPEAAEIYGRVIASQSAHGLLGLDGVWLAPAAGLDRPLLSTGDPDEDPEISEDDDFIEGDAELASAQPA